MCVENRVKYPLFLSDQTSFVKDRPVGTELFHTDGKTDMTKLIIASRNFANAFIKLVLLPSDCTYCHLYELGMSNDCRLHTHVTNSAVNQLSSNKDSI
jgi:hypothetical protein